MIRRPLRPLPHICRRRKPELWKGLLRRLVLLFIYSDKKSKKYLDTGIDAHYNERNYRLVKNGNGSKMPETFFYGGWLYAREREWGRHTPFMYSGGAAAPETAAAQAAGES